MPSRISGACNGCRTKKQKVCIPLYIARAGRIVPVADYPNLSGLSCLIVFDPFCLRNRDHSTEYMLTKFSTISAVVIGT